jgi:hypothetical protein
MQRVSQNEYQLLLSGPYFLTPGVHQYKYVVDGQWQCADDQPTMCDQNYNQNNIIEVIMPPAIKVQGAQNIGIPVYPPATPYSAHPSTQASKQEQDEEVRES